MSQPDPTRPRQPPCGRSFASPLLVDERLPAELVRSVVEVQPGPGADLLAVLVELDLAVRASVDETRERFLRNYETVVGTATDRPDPRPVAVSYLRCLLTRQEIRELLRVEESAGRTAFRVWPDYLMRAQIDRSIRTIKADTAGRAYGTSGAGIVWAVLDTGIDAEHPHFRPGCLDDPVLGELHRDFTWLVRSQPPPNKQSPGSALTDEDGHGTHVAGIIAGAAPADAPIAVATLAPSLGDDDLPRWTTRELDRGRTLSGVAPLATLVSLKVLDASDGRAPTTTSSAVIMALEHVRQVNAGGRAPRIHGVNLSLGCPWSFWDYAAGQSPLCRELDLLVGTGVIAVVSAGNSGYATGDAVGGSGLHGVLSSIADPGNAERAITVGATHRDRPHTFGVSFMSAKGPTLDGRLKPDLVAPGERITSCATGRFRAGIPVLPPDGPASPACYAEQSGTSMAAPHVSGAIAALLSVHPELIGRPEQVTALLKASALSLGRDRFFEGHGLVDLMGALARI